MKLAQQLKNKKRLKTVEYLHKNYRTNKILTPIK